MKTGAMSTGGREESEPGVKVISDWDGVIKTGVGHRKIAGEKFDNMCFGRE